MNSASEIPLTDRDYFLQLDSPAWPPKTLPLLTASPESPRQSAHDGERRSPGKWIASAWASDNLNNAGYIWRRLEKASHSDSEQHKALFEVMTRFPSAPLFGSQRKRDYQVRLRPIHHHTFRLLTAGSPGMHRIEKIFILLNGLNEIDHLGFYYDLASLLAINPHTACILYPTPGHLTRYPMVGKYAERPLHRFMTDPSELFRQYLRFMIELEWLLSTLVPYSCYPVAPGLTLLSDDQDPLRGRSDSRLLTGAIATAWQTMYDFSSKALGNESLDLKTLRQDGISVSRESIAGSIDTLRNLIHWVPADSPLSSLKPGTPLQTPALHVVGYSLGGYLAQSAFFTWPFAISSCTILCSGAALHDLKPIKIAHEEEWRAITHGLKFELESGMLEGRLTVERSNEGELPMVCGIPASHFSYYYCIFSDVFLQDLHGSYRSRVSEFAPRLLFVVGGNDPIVSTRSVMDASPAEGINMIEIANLSHFIATEGGEWTSFWLPTIAGIVSSLGKRCERLLADSILNNLWNNETSGPASPEGWPNVKASTARLRAERPEAESLGSDDMQQMLVDLVEPLQGDAFVFILRNQIPFTLMGPRMLHRRGTAPHYEDFHIREFWQQMQERRKTLLERSDRVTLVLPGRLNEWFAREPSILSEKNLSLVQDRVGSSCTALHAIWHEFLADWETKGALFRFDAQTSSNDQLAERTLEALVRKSTRTPINHPIMNCLPDVWLGFSREALAGSGFMHSTPRRGVHDGFLAFAQRLYEERDGRTETTPMRDNLEAWLASGDFKIVRVSARGGTRFLGERIWHPNSASDLLVHSALALARSEPCQAPGDFLRNWPTSR